MNSFETNPFGVLTFIVAPAILTNASSIMALSTSNRYNHAFDRLRNLSELVGHGGTTPDPETAVRLRQLKLAEGMVTMTTLLGSHFTREGSLPLPIRQLAR
jgi:hypothetical protein